MDAARGEMLYCLDSAEIGAAPSMLPGVVEGIHPRWMNVDACGEGIARPA